jgi:hypothetical protein
LIFIVEALLKAVKKQGSKNSRRRVTLLSGQTHSATASFAPGVIDVVLDRTAHQDDKKGMGEGAWDPKRTAFKFALLLEEVSPESAAAATGPEREVLERLLSPTAVSIARQLNNPVVEFVSNSVELLQSRDKMTAVMKGISPLKAPLPCNVNLVNLRYHSRYVF